MKVPLHLSCFFDKGVTRNFASSVILETHKKRGSACRNDCANAATTFSRVSRCNTPCNFLLTRLLKVQQSTESNKILESLPSATPDLQTENNIAREAHQ